MWRNQNNKPTSIPWRRNRNEPSEHDRAPRLEGKVKNQGIKPKHKKAWMNG